MPCDYATYVWVLYKRRVTDDSPQRRAFLAGEPMKMLYSERKAYAAMSAWWRPAHRLIRALYFMVADIPVARRAWRQYRLRWPA